MTAPRFRDSSLPLGARVDDLLGRLTLAEKVGLLHQYQAPIPRLGVGAFVTGREVLHGVAGLGPATVFPQAIGLASTWNPELVAEVGAAVGTEVRGFHQKDPAHCGLNVWAPVVNLLRDPRWGRNEEGYAEDPLLTAAMGVAYSRGLRGDDPWYLRTAPTLKHFLAYNNETRRCETSSNLPPRVLHEYELPVFRAPVESGAAVAVMAAYNLVNGRPAHLSPLLGTLRRWAADDILVVSDAYAPSNVAGLQHYLPDQATGHAAMLKAGVDSFTDGDADAGPTVERVTEALGRGLLDPSDVDTALRHMLAIRFRLGEFDPPGRNPYAEVSEEVVNCPAHRALAREAARQSIVLLKNAGGGLPLVADEIRRVAVLGPLADRLHEDWYSGTLPYAVTARQGIAERLGPGAVVTFVEGVDRLALRAAGGGGYLTASDRPDGGPLSITAATGDQPAGWFDLFDWGYGVRALRSAVNGRFLTVDEGGTLANRSEQPGGWFVRETFVFEPAGGGVAIRHLATGRYVTVDAAGRCRAGGDGPGEATVFLVEHLTVGAEQAAAVAREADVAVVVVGNHPMINGRETEDRPGLDLPPAQEDLLRAVHAANPRTVAVLTSSYPYAIEEAVAGLPAVVWSAHGGQEFGHALAEVLFGDVGPAGRLTQTWYRRDADLPDLLDYDIIANDATYLYFGGSPLFPFGHGLTYAAFEYTGLRLSQDRVLPGDTVTITVDVRNTGDRDSDEVVQLYSRQSRSRVKQPLRQLRGFRRIRVPAGGRRSVVFPLRAADLGFWDVVAQRYAVETATHDIMAGRSSDDIRLATTLHVAGEQVASWHTGRHPLPAFGADGYENVRFVDATKTDGDAVMAAAENAWVVFEQVSFDPRRTICAARLSGTEAGAARVVLRAGDPLAGPVIADLAVPVIADRYAWRTATGPVTPVEGPVDVYAVLGAPGVCLRELTFPDTDIPA